MENLFKTSLIISIVGIFLLLFLANTLKPQLIKIEEINDKLLNKKIAIQGKIFKIEDKKTFQILSIKDETGKIDILCECKNETMENSQNIIVIGKVQEYQQYLQIQADKIIRK